MGESVRLTEGARHTRRARLDRALWLAEDCFVGWCCLFFSRALSRGPFSDLFAMLTAFLAAATISMAQPWDLRRFARTALYFNSPQEVLKRVPLPGRSPPALGADGVLWSAASSSQPLLEFGPLDDVVMGGVSESSFMTTAADCATFGGFVSTENNGGFAGCRSKAVSPALDLSSYTGLRVRVRGDGVLRRYKCIVRDTYDWNGIAWSSSFDATPAADAGWQVVDLPFDAFVPTLFARRVPGAAKVNTAAINTVQVASAPQIRLACSLPAVAPANHVLSVSTLTLTTRPASLHFGSSR